MTQETKWTLVALAVVVAFVLGWTGGLVTSPRVNTIVAMDYAKALDLEAKMHYAAQLAAEKATLSAQLFVHDAAQQAALQQAKTEAQDAKAEYAAQAKELTQATQRQVAALQQQQQRQLEAYSSEIFSCREQLSAHGIAPRVVAVRPQAAQR